METFMVCLRIRTQLIDAAAVAAALILCIRHQGDSNENRPAMFLVAQSRSPGQYG